MTQKKKRTFYVPVPLNNDQEVKEEYRTEYRLLGTVWGGEVEDPAGGCRIRIEQMRKLVPVVVDSKAPKSDPSPTTAPTDSTGTNKPTSNKRLQLNAPDVTHLGGGIIQVDKKEGGQVLMQQLRALTPGNMKAKWPSTFI